MKASTLEGQNHPHSPRSLKMTEESHCEKKTVALSSALASGVLTTLKLVVGIRTGSLGIISEAAHSALDLVASLITFFAVRVSDQPADEEHRYGHGKAENLSALVETILLLITCGAIAVEAVKRLIKPVSVDATFWAFAVIVLSIGVDVSRSRTLRRVAVKYNSQALAADALNFTADIWSSLVVLLGLGLVRIGQLYPDWAGLHRADAVAALLVAIMIVRVALRMGTQAADVLLDRAPRGMVESIEREVTRVDGVLNCHKVRVRSAGNKSFVDLHVDVDRNLPFERTHSIAEEVERRVETLLPYSNALVHIDPVEHDREKILERIRNIANNRSMKVHNVRVHREKKGIYVDLHLEVDDRLTLKEAHLLASKLERELRAEQPSIVSLTTHIESRRGSETRVEAVTPHMEDTIARVRAIANATIGTQDCHNIQIRAAIAPQLQGAESPHKRLFVSLHVYFDGDMPIGEVHRRSHAVEEKILEAIPGIERVSVHAEPRRSTAVTE